MSTRYSIDVAHGLLGQLLEECSHRPVEYVDMGYSRLVVFWTDEADFLAYHLAEHDPAAASVRIYCEPAGEKISINVRASGIEVIGSYRCGSILSAPGASMRVEYGILGRDPEHRFVEVRVKEVAK